MQYVYVFVPLLHVLYMLALCHGLNILGPLRAPVAVVFC